jgi:hypothetical protein
LLGVPEGDLNLPALGEFGEHGKYRVVLAWFHGLVDSGKVCAIVDA